MKKYQIALLAGLQCALTCHAASSNSGFYVGALTGADFSNFNNKTSSDLIEINQAGDQTIHTKGFLAGIEAGYNLQRGKYLLGLETDIQALSTSGDKNSGAIPYPNLSNQNFVIHTYASNNLLFTARPRIGVYTKNHTLFYLTAGLGLALIQNDFLFTNNTGILESKRVSTVKPGLVLGAGFELPLTHHVSMKTEYLYANFSEMHASNMDAFSTQSQAIKNSTAMKSSMVRLGFNYHLDEQLTGSIFIPCDWKTEIGARLFLSRGIDGAPQALLNEDHALYSRLTYSNLNAISGEIFARADHISGFFTKGYLGAGSVVNGQLNDEDFPAVAVYSNTLSRTLGNISYATIDLGYSFLDQPSGKTGAFLGYNYYAENLNAYNCQQIAGDFVCRTNPGEFDHFVGISQDDRFNSLRIGLTSTFYLSDKLTLTSEAAYLPAINFNGLDTHNARQLLGPEKSGQGTGAMLEALLDYHLTDAWSAGLGARYWMWNMHTGDVGFDFLGSNEPPDTQPGRYNAERYGVFMQLSYRDGEHHHLPWINAYCWKGLYLGGYLGGAWGRSYWSDPFGSTVGQDNLINVAGFGDQIKLTGPLAGINFNFLWQTNKWVYGASANISKMDVRGENTLFSGIDGVNGQTVNKTLATLVARLGITCGPSLFYINAGPAHLNAKYKINGNTAILDLGSQSETNNTWGLTAGVGIEQALTSHWTSNVEYDYVSIPNHDISLPAVAMINTQHIHARQNMNVFKVGVNYKF